MKTLLEQQLEKKHEHNKYLFRKYQSVLLGIAKTQLGRKFLGLDMEQVKDNPIFLVIPNGVHFQLQDQPLNRANFYVWDRLSTRMNPILNFFEMIDNRNWFQAFKYAGISLSVLLLFFTAQLPYFTFLTTSTFNNAITGGTGILSTSSNNWTTIRNGNNLSVGDIWLDFANCGLGARFDGSTYQLIRFWFHFDSSSLPTAPSITSAFLRLVGTSTSNQNGDTDTAHVVQSTGASNTSIATSDWGALGTTSYGSLAYSAMGGSGNYDFTLSAGGISNISDSGYSKFAVRDARDKDDSAPTGLNSRSVSTTASNQVLSVTYAAAYTAALSDTITINESFTKATGRALVDVITIAEVFTKSITRTYTDTITIAETLIKAVGKSFTDTISIAESFAKAIGKNMTDTITIAESFSKAIGRRLTDTITLVDNVITFLLNNVRAGLPKEIRSLLGFKPEGGTRDKDKPEGV